MKLFTISSVLTKASAVLLLALISTSGLKAQQMTVNNDFSCDMLVVVITKDAACNTYYHSTVVPANSTNFTITPTSGSHVTGAYVRINGCAQSPTGVVTDCSAVPGCGCTSTTFTTFTSPLSCCGGGDPVHIGFVPASVDGTLDIS